MSFGRQVCDLTSKINITYVGPLSKRYLYVMPYSSLLDNVLHAKTFKRGSWINDDKGKRIQNSFSNEFSIVFNQNRPKQRLLKRTISLIESVTVSRIFFYILHYTCGCFSCIIIKKRMIDGPLCKITHMAHRVLLIGIV